MADNKQNQRRAAEDEVATLRKLSADYNQRFRKRNEKIADDIDAGVRQVTLARKHSVSPQRISEIYEKVRGTTKRPHRETTPEMLSRAVKHVLREGNVKRAAKDEGVPLSMLTAEVKRLGVKEAYNERKLEEARELLKKGWSLEETAEFVEKSITWLRKNGVWDGVRFD